VFAKTYNKFRPFYVIKSRVNSHLNHFQIFAMYLEQVLVMIQPPLLSLRTGLQGYISVASSAVIFAVVWSAQTK